MKKILIIGASILQLPAIRKAKEMGLEVAVADYNPNAIGIPFADKYYNASTIDVEAIVNVAKEYKPDGIMTLATDMPMRSIAAATTALGIAGISYETAIMSTDKVAMAAAFRKKGVPAPWYHEIKSKDHLYSLKGEINYPCIMKPADNSGSRGVIFISSENELEVAYEYSLQQSREGGVILEEYLAGEEVSVEIIVHDGHVHILQVTDKITTGVPNFVEMGHSQPSHFKNEDLAAIKKVATEAINAVGIKEGPAHVEMMVTKDGPKMIELGARLGGDCITTHLVPLSTGIDMIKATIAISLGEEPDLSVKANKGSAIKYIDTAQFGTIESVEGIDDAKKSKGIQEVILTKNVGDIIEPIHSSLDRVGMVISQGENRDLALKYCEEAINKITIKSKQNE